MRDSPKVQWINVLTEAIHCWVGEDRAPRDSPGYYYYRTHNGVLGRIMIWHIDCLLFSPINEILLIILINYSLTPKHFMGKK